MLSIASLKKKKEKIKTTEKVAVEKNWKKKKRERAEHTEKQGRNDQ